MPLLINVRNGTMPIAEPLLPVTKDGKHLCWYIQRCSKAKIPVTFTENKQREEAWFFYKEWDLQGVMQFDNWLVTWTDWCATDYYSVLGVGPSATADLIKAKYHAKSKTEHPDKGGDRSLFEAVKTAYDVLKDPRMRPKYDCIYKMLAHTRKAIKYLPFQIQGKTVLVRKGDGYHLTNSLLKAGTVGPHFRASRNMEDIAGCPPAHWETIVDGIEEVEYGVKWLKIGAQADTSPSAPSQESFSVGEKVECDYSGTWYQGKVVECAHGGRIQVMWDADGTNTWFSSPSELNCLRRPRPETIHNLSQSVADSSRVDQSQAATEPSGQERISGDNSIASSNAVSSLDKWTASDFEDNKWEKILTQFTSSVRNVFTDHQQVAAETTNCISSVKKLCTSLIQRMEDTRKQRALKKLSDAVDMESQRSTLTILEEALGNASSADLSEKECWKAKKALDREKLWHTLFDKLRSRLSYIETVHVTEEADTMNCKELDETLQAVVSKGSTSWVRDTQDYAMGHQKLKEIQRRLSLREVIRDALEIEDDEKKVHALYKALGMCEPAQLPEVEKESLRKEHEIAVARINAKEQLEEACKIPQKAGSVLEQKTLKTLQETRSLCEEVRVDTARLDEKISSLQKREAARDAIKKCVEATPPCLNTMRGTLETSRKASLLPEEYCEIEQKVHAAATALDNLENAREAKGPDRVTLPDLVKAIHGGSLLPLRDLERAMDVASVKEMRLMVEEEVRSAEVERPYDEQFLSLLEDHVRNAGVCTNRVIAARALAQKRDRVERGIRYAMEKFSSSVPELVRVRDSALKDGMAEEVERLGLNRLIEQTTAREEKSKALVAEPKDLNQLSRALASCRSANLPAAEVEELEKAMQVEEKKLKYLKKLYEESAQREEKRRQQAEEEKRRQEEEKRRLEAELAKKKADLEDLADQIKQGEELGVSNLDLEVYRTDHANLLQDIAATSNKIALGQQPLAPQKQKPRMKGTVAVQSECDTLGLPPAPVALQDAPASSAASSEVEAPPKRRRELPKSKKQSMSNPVCDAPADASAEAQLAIATLSGDEELESEVRAAFTWAKDRDDKDIIVLDLMKLANGMQCLANGMNAGQLVCATYSKKKLDNESIWVSPDNDTDTLMPNTQLFTTPDGITVGGRSGNKANRAQGMGVALAVAAAVRDPAKIPHLGQSVGFRHFAALVAYMSRTKPQSGPPRRRALPAPPVEKRQRRCEAPERW